MIMKSLRVLVLDDSPICRAQLRAFLEKDGDIKVVGEAENGDNVLALLSRSRAQVLLVDLQMPGTGGHETISTVMANQPLPILVVTGQPMGDRKAVVFESVRRGALELAEKPHGLDSVAQERLRQTVRSLASVPVVRHVSGKKFERSARIPPVPQSELPREPKAETLIVGIGSSAGGPLALSTLLAELPARFPAAIAVAQHIPGSFVSAFAEFLSDRTSLEVEVLTKSAPVRPGCVYLPAGDAHLLLEEPGVLTRDPSTPIRGYRPSVDLLFETLAYHARSRSAGVVLSGIGQDGTEGLLKMRLSGALCLSQAQQGCAVWGMPRAALESGAAEKALNPVEIASMVCKWAELNAISRHGVSRKG